MELLINGTTLKIPTEISTITELITHLELNSPVIIVEHNEVILKNEEHENRNIEDGDKIEFIQFVGGG